MPLESFPVGRLAAAAKAVTPAAAVLLAITQAPLARAADSFSPFATVAFEHNSNVFMRPSSAPPFAASGITALGDTIEEYGGGLSAELDFGPDKLKLDGKATRDEYDQFSFLDHTEYNFGAHLDWQLGPMVDGTASYVQSRYLTPFTETLSTQLLLETEQTATATVRITVNPLWRIDLTPGLHRLDTPVPGFPGFALRETTGAAELDYLGFGRLTTGLEYEYDQGRYEGIVGATKYDQGDVDLTASYKVSGLSSFSASAGYTRRDSELNVAGSVPAPVGTTYGGFAGTTGTTSGATGSLSYHRQLTGKTSTDLSIFRSVESYTAGANPEVATGGSVAVNWKADPKFTFNLSYSLARDEIQGGLIVINTINRTDRTQTATFGVRYAALSWLAIHPYVDWTRAISNFTLGNYSQTIVGIEVTALLSW